MKNDLQFRIQPDGSVKEYKKISFTQVWGMAEWIEDQKDRVGEAFYQVDQIRWLLEQGYKGEISRYHNIASDNFHISITFTIPEEVYTFIVLKWPEEVMQVNFDGPTIKGNMYAMQS